LALRAHAIAKKGKIEISGRFLGLIADGIEQRSQEIAASVPGCAPRGVTFQTISYVETEIGDAHSIIPEPLDEDAAHAYIDHRASNTGQVDVLISREVVRFAAPGSAALIELEERAGTASLKSGLLGISRFRPVMRNTKASLGR
jgi:hypothetical protein